MARPVHRFVWRRWRRRNGVDVVVTGHLPSKLHPKVLQCSLPSAPFLGAAGLWSAAWRFGSASVVNAGLAKAEQGARSCSARWPDDDHTGRHHEI